MKTSASITKIAPALLAAQKSLQAAIKDADNPHFKSKFAELSSIIEVAQPALNEQGIAFLQPVSYKEGRVVVETVLLHESGEWLSEELEIPLAKMDAQGVGSCVTYGRRYGLQAFVGIKAVDDDGNAASEPQKPQVSRFQQQAKDSLLDRVSQPQFRPGVDFDPAEFDESQEEPPLEAYEDPFGNQGKRQNPDADMVPVSTPLQKAQQAISKAPAKASGAISEGQIKRLWAIAKGAGKDKGYVMGIVGEFGFDTVDAIGWQKYNAIIERIQS